MLHHHTRADIVSASVVSGIAAVSIGHPLDSIKVRMQTSLDGTAVAATRSLWSEGALLRGIGAPLLNSLAMNIVIFLGFEEAKSTLGLTGPQAGALSGVAGAFIGTPFDRLKILAQTERSQRHHPSSGRRRSMGSTLRSAGPLQALYAGHGMNMMREGIFGAIYLGLYDMLRDWYSLSTRSSLETSPLPLAFTAAASGTTGALAWLAAYPTDVIKTIQQASRSPVGGTEAEAVPSAQTVAKQLWKEQGIRGFYRGAVAGTLRAVLVTSTRLVFYELYLGNCSLTGFG